MDKVCSRCKIVKDVSCFHKQKSNKSGFHSYCKECQRIDLALYRARNMGKVKAYFKQYRIDKKRQIRTKMKKWLDENREKCQLKQKEWKKSNTEKVKKSQLKKYRKSVDSITDSYLRNELRNQGFPKGAITPELMAVKKEIIKIKRICKRKSPPKI